MCAAHPRVSLKGGCSSCTSRVLALQYALLQVCTACDNLFFAFGCISIITNLHIAKTSLRNFMGEPHEVHHGSGEPAVKQQQQ